MSDKKVLFQARLEFGSFDIVDALVVLFIGLKLTSNIAWSWILVLSPYIIQLAIYGIIWVITKLVNRGINESWIE